MENVYRKYAGWIVWPVAIVGLLALLEYCSSGPRKPIDPVHMNRFLMVQVCEGLRTAHLSVEGSLFQFGKEQVQPEAAYFEIETQLSSLREKYCKK